MTANIPSNQFTQVKFSYGSLRAQPFLDSLCVSLQPLGIDSDGLTVLFDHPLRHGTGIILEELLHLLSFLLRHKPCCSNLKGRGEKAQEVEQFFKDNPCAMAERVVKQNCEAIRVNAKWLQRDTQAVKEWLSTQ